MHLEVLIWWIEEHVGMPAAELSQDLNSANSNLAEYMPVQVGNKEKLH